MPLQTLWHTEPHIRTFYGIGKITQDEFNEAVKGELSALIASPVKLYYLIDIQDMSSFSVNPLAAGPLLDFLKQPQLGWLALVGNSTVINYWAQVLRTVAQMRLRPFGTVDNAIGFLNDMIALEQGDHSTYEAEFHG